jgi:hypothetical protein
MRVRCRNCELLQEHGGKCRRCGKPLPEPLVNVRVEVRDLHFGPTAPVQPLHVIKKRAIIHALKKSSTVVEAAARLQIGKTTLYRLLEVYGWRHRKYETIMQKIEEKEQSVNTLPPEQNYLFSQE